MRPETASREHPQRSELARLVAFHQEAEEAAAATVREPSVPEFELPPPSSGTRCGPFGLAPLAKAAASPAAAIEEERTVEELPFEMQLALRASIYDDPIELPMVGIHGWLASLRAMFARLCRVAATR